MGNLIRGAPVLAVLILVSFGMTASAPPENGNVGSDQCAVCHEKISKAFESTPHATAPGWRTERGCESCHGPGLTHVETGEVSAILRPNTMPAAEATEICLGCHQERQGQFNFEQSAHSRNDVGCVDCHNPHLTSDKMLRKESVEMCATCHRATVAQFDLPRSHPLNTNGGGCVQCHDPHSSDNSRMTKSFGNQTCTDCHMDKSGPFLYEHDVSIMEGCESCHQIHGSVNRHLLTHGRSINLCYQCHTGASTPTFHNAQNFLNEKCTACHTAIHGSNTNAYFLEE